MSPAEFIYYLGYSYKKRRALSRQRGLPYKVVSIGNITVGGTGKTPAAIAVAEEAKKRGYRPVILTRGYRGKAKGPCLVNDGAHILSVDEAGDEPVVMAGRLRDVPVVKSADRYEGGIFAIRQLGSGGAPIVFILDDGFQHWRLTRDADVVLVDGLNPFGNRRLLPAGPLRGPISELAKADIIVITKVRNTDLEAEIRGVNSCAPVYFSSYEVTGLRSAGGNLLDLGLIKEKKIFAFCGIANPASFRETITNLGGRIAGLESYRDHYRYSQKDMTDLKGRSGRAGADYLITTEKDMVKLRELPQLPSNLLSVEIGFKVDTGFYDAVFGKLQQ